MVASAIGAVLGGATSLIAGNKEAKAAKQAAALQQRQYEQSRADVAPWREVGSNALAQLAALHGLSGEDARRRAMVLYRASPGYQFRLAGGQRALDHSAAARGALLSGNQLRALTEYGQNLAAQDYGDYANQLASLAGLGQTAATGSANVGAAAAGRTAEYLLGAADARSDQARRIGAAIAPAIQHAFRRRAGYYPGDTFT